jgi:chemotaxis protein MotB
MKPTFKLLMLIVLAGGLLTSCVSNKKYNELLAAKEASDKVLAETQTQLKTLQSDYNTLQSEKNNLMSEIEAVKKDLASTKGQIEEVRKMVSAKDAEISRIKGEISSAFANLNKPGLSVRQDGESFYVSMEEKLLFKSGSTVVSKSGKAILDKFAEFLNNNKDLRIDVEGHTDNKQFIGGGRFSDNWELSVGRSSAVVKYLVKKGVDASRLSASGRGETAPVVANDTAENRQMNRRVEFSLTPTVSKLYQMTKG